VTRVTRLECSSSTPDATADGCGTLKNVNYVDIVGVVVRNYLRDK